jgi:hypothetical protein
MMGRNDCPKSLSLAPYIGRKSDRTARWSRHLRELPNRVHYPRKRLVVLRNPGFQLIEFFSEIPIRHQQRTQANKRANHQQAHLNRSWRLQHIAQHEGSVFGKGERQCGRESQPRKVVTICDHLGRRN